MAKALKVAGIIVGVAALAIVTGGAAVGLGLSMATTFAGVSAGALMLASVGLSAASSLLAARPKAPATSEAIADRLTVSIDARTPRKFALGRTALATDLRDQEYSDDQTWLDRFILVAAHAVQSIEEIWFDDYLAWRSDGGVTEKVGGYLEVTTVLEGSPANAIYTSARMGLSRRYTGCAYVRLRYRLKGLTKDKESPFAQSIPSRVTIVGRAARLYDPRYDDTAGGSGPQRATDQTTWTWNDQSCRNPALALLWYLLGYRIKNPATGEWKLSVGQSVPPARIDLASFITAANLCDEPVLKADGSYEPRYRCDGLFSEGDAPKVVLDALKATMNAVLDDVDGKLRLTVLHNDLATPAGSLSTDDVLGDFRWDQTPALSDTFNVVRGSYTDPSPTSLYQQIDAPEVRIPSPDGIERVETVNLPTVQSASQKQRLDKQRVRRMLYSGIFSATFQVTAWKYQKGDVVRFTFRPLGWVDKLFRIVDMTVQVDGRVPMVLKVEHPAIYADDGTEAAPILGVEPTRYDLDLDPIRRRLKLLANSVERGAYDPEETYFEGNIVSLPNRSRWLFINPVPTVGEQPSLESDRWDLLQAPDTDIDRGAFDPSVAYEMGNIVSLPDGSRWRYVADVAGQGGRPGGDGQTWVRIQGAIAVLPPETVVGGTLDPVTGGTNGGRPVGDLIDDIDALDDLTKDLRGAQIDLEDAGRQRDRAFAQIAEALKQALLGLDGVNQVITSAGITVDPGSGKASIYGVDVTREQMTKLLVQLDAVQGELSLKATRTYVDQQIAQAQLPGLEADLSQIFLRIYNAEIDLWAAKAQLALKADATVVSGLAASVTTLDQTLDALAGTVTTKADKTTVTALDTKVTSVQATIAAGDRAGFSREAIQVRYLNDIAGSLIDALLTQSALDDQRIVQAAQVREEIYTKLSDDLASEAGQRLQLTAITLGVKADLEEERRVRSAADAAEATSRQQLTAQINHPTSGLPAAHARVDTETAARIAGDTAEATARQQLAAQVNHPTSGLPAAHARVDTETAARIAGDTAEASARQQLAAQVNHPTTGLPAAHARVDNETAARIAGDTAEATARQQLAAQVNDPTSGLAAAHARVDAETAARIAGDTAEATSRQQLAAQVNNPTTGLAAAHARVDTETAARIAGDTAEATSRQQLAAQVNHPTSGLPAAHARVDSETAARVAGDTAEASARESLAAQINNGITGLPAAHARITAESNVRAAQLSAEVTAREQLAAVIYDPSGGLARAHALIVSERQARVDGDTAEAQQRTQLATTVNGQTSSIDFLLSVANGNEAKAQLLVGSNGRVTGFRINGQSRVFDIDADFLRVGGEGIFEVDTQAGVVRMRYVEVERIRVGAVGSTQIAGSAVQQAAYARTYGDIVVPFGG